MKTEIAIGGRLVSVPVSYVQAEAEYTKDADFIFWHTSDAKLKAAARREVLAKRVEFYEKWLAGEIELPEEPEPKKDWFTRFIEWLDD